MPSLIASSNSRSFTSLSNLSGVTSSTSSLSVKSGTSPTSSRRHLDPNQESVYRWIPKDNNGDSSSSSGNGKEMKAQYKSIYGPQSREEYKKARSLGKMSTMGPAKVKADDPKRFLKKHTCEKRFENKRHPNEDHFEAEHKHKDLKLPLWEPKYPAEEPFPVPEYPKRGGKRPTELECYREKKDYGRVPDYIKNRKDEVEHVEKAKKILEAQNVEVKQTTLNGLKRLSERERREILDALQDRWKELTLEFQKLPLVTDTVPKINRKVGLERELKKLETEIERFSHDNILIYE